MKARVPSLILFNDNVFVHHSSLWRQANESFLQSVKQQGKFLSCSLKLRKEPVL